MSIPHRFAAVFAAALFVTGCSASSQYMHEAAAPSLAPAADKATVVFIRHSGMARGIRTTILDEHGDFVGDSLASSWFTRTYDPGKHMFVAWAENTDVLQADLAPGKVYYVEVDPTMGALSARMHLYALKPGGEDWGKVKEWLGDNKYLEVDVNGGRAAMHERQSDVAERLKRASEHLAEYQGEDLEKRTLRPGDGG